MTMAGSVLLQRKEGSPSLLPSAPSFLSSAASVYDLYLVIKVKSRDEEHAVLDQLRDLNFDTKVLLFSSLSLFLPIPVSVSVSVSLPNFFFFFFFFFGKFCYHVCREFSSMKLMKDWFILFDT